jgi:protein CpxP
MTTEPDSGPASPGHRQPRGVRKLLLGVAFAGAFVAGGLVFSGATLAAEGMAMHGGGHMAMHAMMEGHVDKMLAAVDATPDQKARVHEILKGAMQSMGPLHERLASAHVELHQLLIAPTIDRAALEHLRAEKMADVDQASRTLVQALGDAAEVLTPEQRAKVGKLMAEHHSEH